MKPALGALALVTAALASGCSPVTSIRPLYTDAELQKPVVEPRIEGEWISPNTEEPEKAGTDEQAWLRWKITPADKPAASYSYYSVEFRPVKPDPGKGEEASSYEVRLVAIGDTLFFDAEFRSHTEGQVVAGAWDSLGLVPAHIIGRIWVQQDFLRIALLQPEWLEQNAPASFQEIHYSKYVDDCIITGSTQQLRDLLGRNADNQKALAYVAYLCRPGTDCGTRAAEDALARAPDDDEVLDGTAEFFFARHSYARAAALRKRRVQLEPQDITRHSDLSNALLFSRDFRGARRELEEVQKLTLGDPPATVDSLRNQFGNTYASASERIVWSYFLEGAFAEVVNAAKRYQADEEHFSLNPLLLTYFSLLRLDRPAEAQSLLQEETARFKGSAEEHILLLDAQGRVSAGFPYSDPQSEALRRTAFFGGLRDIAAGRRDSARLHLEYAASGQSDGIIALAAKIELERLGPKPK